MQMAVIEAARDLVGIAKAGSTEFGPSEEPVVGLMTEWMRGNELEKRQLNGDLGGTMRLGAYPAQLAKGSQVAKIYGDTQISERHRHRYEVNTAVSRAAGGGGRALLRHVTRRAAARDRRAARPPLVHRRPVPPASSRGRSSRTPVSAIAAAEYTVGVMCVATR